MRSPLPLLLQHPGVLFFSLWPPSEKFESYLFSVLDFFFFKKGGMCNYHTSVRQMHAFFRKDDKVDVVNQVLVPVPWLQAGVENVAVGPCSPPQAVRRRLWVSSPGFPLQTDSSLSREAPGLGPCIAGASGRGRVLKPSPWELRQPHWLPLPLPLGVWPRNYQGTGFAKK